MATYAIQAGVFEDFWQDEYFRSDLLCAVDSGKVLQILNSLPNDERDEFKEDVDLVIGALSQP